MILPNTKIILRQNENCKFSGIDSIEGCRDKEYFKTYPHAIDYTYNHRGFRDSSWPDNVTDLQQAIWCFGDSFTSGVGVPYTHMWTQVLQKQSGRRTINVSLDGASNEWISRHVNYVLNEVCPETVVIHWSYSHRREAPLKPILDSIWADYYQQIKDPLWPACGSYDDVDHLPESVQEDLRLDPKFNSWSDEFDLETPRRIIEGYSTAEEDLKNTQNCIDSIIPGNNIIHSFIPKWHPVPATINFDQQVHIIPEFEILDYGRDYHHYDIRTAEYFVKQILTCFS